MPARQSATARRADDARARLSARLRKQQRIAGRCVPIVCEANFALDEQGVCRKRPESPKKPKAISRQEPAAHVAPTSDGGGQNGCHSFEGKLYCQ